MFDDWGPALTRVLRLERGAERSRFCLPLRPSPPTPGSLRGQSSPLLWRPFAISTRGRRSMNLWSAPIHPIVAGEVLDMRSAWTADRHSIFTTVTLPPDRRFKGREESLRRFRIPGERSGTSG